MTRSLAKHVEQVIDDRLDKVLVPLVLVAGGAVFAAPFKNPRPIFGQHECAVDVQAEAAADREWQKAEDRTIELVWRSLGAQTPAIFILLYTQRHAYAGNELGEMGTGPEVGLGEGGCYKPVCFGLGRDGLLEEKAVLG